MLCGIHNRADFINPTALLISFDDGKNWITILKVKIW